MTAQEARKITNGERPAEYSQAVNRAMLHIRVAAEAGDNRCAIRNAYSQDVIEELVALGFSAWPKRCDLIISW